jgi:methylated-DNA-[protein]-cysteine S-methyltransferase
MLRPMRIAYHVMSAPGPLGLLFLARTERGLRHLEFLDKRSIKRTIEAHRSESPGATWEASLIDLKGYVDQLEGYFCGALTQFDFALDPVGSEFQMEVWKALLEIPYGETRTYGQIARTISQPRASRAVGLANNQNPIAIAIPCHRVIGADGNLTGYGGGLPRKRWLLAHEAHFGAMAGVTLDLFAATGSLPTTRIASGDGPPLGTQRLTSANAPREEAPPAARATTTRLAAKAVAKPAVKPAAKAAAKPASTSSKTTPRGSARPAARSGVRAPARAASKPALRPGTKLAARPARSPRRTAR